MTTPVLASWLVLLPLGPLLASVFGAARPNSPRLPLLLRAGALVCALGAAFALIQLLARPALDSDSGVLARSLEQHLWMLTVTSWSIARLAFRADVLTSIATLLASLLVLWRPSIRSCALLAAVTCVLLAENALVALIGWGVSGVLARGATERAQARARGSRLLELSGLWVTIAGLGLLGWTLAGNWVLDPEQYLPHPGYTALQTPWTTAQLKIGGSRMRATVVDVHHPERDILVGPTYVFADLSTALDTPFTGERDHLLHVRRWDMPVLPVVMALLLACVLLRGIGLLWSAADLEAIGLLVLSMAGWLWHLRPLLGLTPTPVLGGAIGVALLFALLRVLSRNGEFWLAFGSGVHEVGVVLSLLDADVLMPAWNGIVTSVRKLAEAIAAIDHSVIDRAWRLLALRRSEVRADRSP
jgi:hypothetical protein